MRIRIEAPAALAALAALGHAYFAAPLLFWPLVSLMATSLVLAMHSPLALSRRMTFLAHAQGHSILTAALAAALVLAAVKTAASAWPFYGLVLMFVIVLNLAVLAVGRLGYREDVATGVVMSLQISATIALLFAVRMFYGASVDPIAIITGEYVLVGLGDVAAQTPFLALASLFPLFYGVRYLYAAIDESFAEAIGLRPKLMDNLFLISMSLAVASSVYTLGSLMPAVLLVMPGAIAARYTTSIIRLIPTSASAAALSVAAAHFIYTLLPWLWPSAAIGLVQLVMLLAKPKAT
jgi:zinc/manganese transport system permease protein